MLGEMAEVRIGRDAAARDRKMNDKVWISEVMSNGTLGEKLGLRQKWFHEPWEAPYLNHRVPTKSKRVFEAISRHSDGYTVQAQELPEASAVYSASDFRRVKDVFFLGAFLAVKGKVADVLSKFDFGTGGGLVPHTIYEADEKTPLKGPFYIVNFGPMKDCFLPDSSTGLIESVVNATTGNARWFVDSTKDGDVAVSTAALGGSDLWMCPGVGGRIFMSDRLVEALKSTLDTKLFGEFRLYRCRVVE